MVPTVITLDNSKNLKVLDKIEGVDPAGVTQAVRRLMDAFSLSTLSIPSEQEGKEGKEETVDDKLHRLVNSSKVMVFMKGTPLQPKCGFSKQVVALLQECNISFHTFDVLNPNEQDVRSGLKEKYDWPTYPQIYVRGELIGGLDIIKEMMEDSSGGDLATQLAL